MQIAKKGKKGRKQISYVSSSTEKVDKREKITSLKSVNETELCSIGGYAFVNTYPRRIFPEEAATSSHGQNDKAL